MVINESVCPAPKLDCRVNVKEKNNSQPLLPAGGGGKGGHDQVPGLNQNKRGEAVFVRKVNRSGP